ncbi:branched-chain amino acid ABC transporter ATP-binding protein/permease [Oryzicola mucosus]|uniref:ATP-binding cassette domain-containing protein n=1 Tax=Oryzicola mucosus TaxID=2767425 RepID=A0A8J6PMG8_9HYPH|nr:ATP-binding cassette domain-containing protein [Oryzicola mucosus]MBD0417349.1 ATP-binding cassette domain-containing protein [Oryzicola mucosus]
MTSKISTGEHMIAARPSTARTGPSILDRSAKIQVVIGIAILVVATVVPSALGLSYWIGVINLATIYIVASVFMGLLLVDAGQVSFGHGAVFGAAAYAVGVACGMHGFSFPVGILFGVAAALVIGILFALPALRVQWFYLGFVTLSAAMVFPQMLFAFDSLTNGLNGISIPFTALNTPTAIGLSILSILSLVLGSLAILTSAIFPKTKLGRRMRVAAASPEAAQSLGISPGRMRFTAFMIASFGTGLAGVLYPPTVGFVSPNAFHLDISILFFFAVIVGGKGQPLGTIAGITLLYMLPNVFLAQLVEYRPLVYGLVAFLVMLLMPSGIIGGIVRWLTLRQKPQAMPALQFSQIVDATQSAKHPVGDIAIEIEGLRKVFGNVVAINNVSMNVRRGEIHGLVGANGSGKTSLLNVLNGFTNSDAGSVKVNGKEITSLKARDVAHLGVGRTFQTPRILEQLGAWDNVQIGLDAKLSPNPTRVSPAFVDSLRDTLGRLRTESIPHGQRRLLEVIRVILTDADILLLDEPAAGLSPEERVAFAGLLRDLRDKLGLTIVFVEHDLDLVARVADRVTVLESGAVIASGDVASVWENPRVKPLFVTVRHA